MKSKIFLVNVVLSLGLAASFATSAHATTPTVGTFARISATMDQRTVTIKPPTSNSPGRWSYVSSDPTVASISGNVITLLNHGYARITATQAASGEYDSVTKVTELLVTKGTPVVGPISDLTVSFDSGSVKIPGPTNSSGLPWLVTNSNPSIATYSNGVLTFKNVGILNLTFTQQATDNWNSASATMGVTIIPVKPTLGVFGNISIGLGSVASLNLTPPTSNSKGAWSFDSSNPTVASVIGSTVYPIGIGTATITARQTQFLPYAAASLSMTMTVTGSPASVNQWSDMVYDLTANKTAVLAPPTSTSMGSWSYSIADPSLATIQGNVLTLLNAGTTTLTASQAATGTYNASGPYTAKLTIMGSPTISAPTNIVRVAGDPAITFTAPHSISSGSFTYSSSNPQVISVSGNVGTIVGAGTAVITATQAADSFWKSGTTTFSIQVNGLVPTIGSWAPISFAVGEKKAILPPASNSKGVWSLSSVDPSILSITDGVATALKVGTTTITGTQAAAGLYGLSNIVQTQVTVSATAAPTPTPSPSAKPSVSPMPSSTPMPSPTPKPSVSATPSSTPIPIPTPTIKPTPTPAKPSTISLKVTTGAGSITVTSSSKTLVVFIDGEVKLMGKNAVKAGKHLVTVRDGAKVLYSKSVTVK